jgi:NADP-dependent aldehyde dehydrogenase
MTVRQEQAPESTDTTPDELNRLIGAAAGAARVLVDSRPTDRAGWLEAVADRMDAGADDLVPLAAR